MSGLCVCAGLELREHSTQNREQHSLSGACCVKKGVGIVEAGEVSWGQVIRGHSDFILKAK